MPILADVFAATRELEVALPLPDEDDWFDTVPFTTVVGPIGSGKTTYVGLWLSQIAARSGRQVVWIQLKPTSSPEDVERQVVSQLSGKDGPPTAVGARTAAVATVLERQLEGTKRATPILCFDDWNPRLGGAHALVSELAAGLQRTPIVATSESARSSVGAAAVRQVPRPSEDDWNSWCESSHVPQPVREVFLRKIHHNLLAASLCKGAVFFGTAADPASLDTTWHDLVQRLPAGDRLQWDALIGECVRNIGDTGFRILRLLASATEPAPQSWLGKDLATSEASRLLEHRFARSVLSQGTVRVAVHPIFQSHLGTRNDDHFPWLKDQTPDPALVELLLNIGMFEDAARVISSLVEQELPSSEAPTHVIDWVDRLPAEVTVQFPMVLFGVVRALALRARAGDLQKAMVTIQLLLSLTLSEGQRWRALNQAADVAIRELDYDRAVGFVNLAEGLYESSAGSFDVQALDVLRARIHWEQSGFAAAKSALEVVRPGLDRVESARHASWLARTHASLGDFARAAGAANRGIEIGRRSKAPRAEAYNLVLLAEYEIVRGNLSRARRFAERASQIADARSLTNLRAQALAAQADAASAQGESKEADRLLEMANDQVTARGDDPWTNAYLLVTQARLARFQPRWTQLWSLAQRLEMEAGVLASRAVNHPVVGDLLVESAHSLMATGYSHEAQRLLRQLNDRPLNWRAAWEARLLAAVSEVDTPNSERAQRVSTLIQEAREAGAPYLAATCAYLASAYPLVNGDDSLAQTFGQWAAEVAESRGWQVLASKARALSPVPASSDLEEHATLNEFGTFAAPRRAQSPARRDPEIPLPDPFDE
jgi:tetratricopeptide (TPR) repeat protein